MPIDGGRLDVGKSRDRILCCGFELEDATVSVGGDDDYGYDDYYDVFLSC
jgi:hypothetical protein